MVDIIGSVANQATSALMGAKKVDAREKTPLVSPSSPKMVDEVSISNEAMDIGRVMEIVQDAKTRVENDPQVTLSGGNSERLDMLV